MIKKLRRRFIIINMCILTSVLLGVLTGIYTYMYSSEVKISYELMESILNERNNGFKEHDVIYDEEKDNEEIDDEEKKFEKKDEQEKKALQSLSFRPDDNNDDRYRPDNFNDFQNDNRAPDHQIPDQQWQNPPPHDNNNNDKYLDPYKSDNKNKDDVFVNPPVSTTKNKTTQPTVQKTTVRTVTTNTNKNNITTASSKNKNTNITATSTVISINTGSNTNMYTDSMTSSTSSNVPATGGNPPEIPDNPPEDIKPPKDEFPDPYKGRVKRSYIMVQFGDDENIENVIYRYLENTSDDEFDENEVVNASKTLIEKDNDRGIITIAGRKLRYMKKSNPRTENGGGRLLFLDRTLEISTISRLLFIFIIIGSVGIVVIFGISVLLANWMIKPVDRAWKQQKQFVADASHELKTPLTVISSNTDVILSSPDDTVKSQIKWLDYIKAETKRMTKLVNNMLYIAKYDSNEIKMTLCTFNFSETLSSICLQYEALLFEKGRMIETEIEDNISVTGDEDKLKQLVNILLDNAGKYSTENSKINVRLAKDQKNGKIILKVSNASEYIPADKLEHLFDRFYRLDASRNRKNGGSGLGLNIAQSIVETHKGKISANHENGITEFVVIL